MRDTGIRKSSGAGADLGQKGADLLVLAYELALANGQQVVGSDHLLVAGKRLFRASDVQGLGLMAELSFPEQFADVDEEQHAYSELWNLDGALNEARWRAVRFRKPAERELLLRRRESWPVWSLECRAVVATALRLASKFGLTYVGWAYLLEAALSRPGSRASVLCAQLGIRSQDLLRSLESSGALSVSDPPAFTLVNNMGMVGAVQDDIPWLARAAAKGMSRMMSRASGMGSPVLKVLEPEVVRQAARLGQAATNTAHLVLAALSLDVQLSIAGQPLIAEFAPYNRVGAVLGRHGVTLSTAFQAAQSLPSTSEQEQLSWDEAKNRFVDGDNPADPVWGRRAAEVFPSARDFRGQRGDANTGTSHLLAAAVAEDDSAAVELLTACGIDVGQLRQEIVEDLDQALH